LYKFDEVPSSSRTKPIPRLKPIAQPTEIPSTADATTADPAAAASARGTSGKSTTAMSAPASTVPSPSETSFDVQSLHHPTEQALVQVPQAQTQEQLPAGVSAMTGKAFLAKKMAASGFAPSLFGDTHV
jgi:hypothetical protein